MIECISTYKFDRIRHAQLFQKTASLESKVLYAGDFEIMVIIRNNQILLFSIVFDNNGSSVFILFKHRFV